MLLIVFNSEISFEFGQ